MKTLCIQYTPDTIYFSLAMHQTIINTKSFSSKELKMFIFHLQNLLTSSDSKFEEINTICVNTGPAPAFTQRSLFALINGISFSLRSQEINLSLYAIDDFALLCKLYQQKEQDNFVITVANAYANDLFFLYYEKNKIQSGIATVEEFIVTMKELNISRAIHIIGTITEAQEQLFSSHNFLVTNNTFVPHIEYCTFALLPEKWQKIQVNYLLPQYVKRHQVELKLEKKDNFT